MSVAILKPDDPDAYTVAEEVDILRWLVPLDGTRVLELGCGSAEMTRTVAEHFAVVEMIATDVDEIQHTKNLGIQDLPGVHFRLEGAESITEADNSIDVVLMFKSLHHVPESQMDRALKEIRRVLKPGGYAYISEPIFAGDFNAILRLFHDEEKVRIAAFEAVKRAVRSGLFALQEEVFFQVSVTYPDFETFEQKVIHTTHTRHVLDEVSYLEVRKRFMAHMGKQGATFLKPMRVDLLRKPLST